MVSIYIYIYIYIYINYILADSTICVYVQFAANAERILKELLQNWKMNVVDLENISTLLKQTLW